LARRLDHDASGVSASIHEALDEMLTVIRLGLPDQLRRSLGCTNAIQTLIWRASEMSKIAHVRHGAEFFSAGVTTFKAPLRRC